LERNPSDDLEAREKHGVKPVEVGRPSERLMVREDLRIEREPFEDLGPMEDPISPLGSGCPWGFTDEPKLARGELCPGRADPLRTWGGRVVQEKEAVRPRGYGSEDDLRDF
jgi:hypothetical protein